MNKTTLLPIGLRLRREKQRARKVKFKVESEHGDEEEKVTRAKATFFLELWKGMRSV
jgi:hypothetical protein